MCQVAHDVLNQANRQRGCAFGHLRCMAQIMEECPSAAGIVGEQCVLHPCSRKRSDPKRKERVEQTSWADCITANPKKSSTSGSQDPHHHCITCIVIMQEGVGGMQSFPKRPEIGSVATESAQESTTAPNNNYQCCRPGWYWVLGVSHESHTHNSGIFGSHGCGMACKSHQR